MYAYIKGTLEETGEDYIVVEAGGIGYQIFTTGQTFQYLPVSYTHLTLPTIA